MTHTAKQLIRVYTSGIRQVSSECGLADVTAACLIFQSYTPVVSTGPRFAITS